MEDHHTHSVSVAWSKQWNKWNNTASVWHFGRQGSRLAAMQRWGHVGVGDRNRNSGWRIHRLNWLWLGSWGGHPFAREGVMPLKPRPSSSCRPARMAASAADLVGQDRTLTGHLYVLPPSEKSYGMRVSQTDSSLTKFIVNSINIYVFK
jgi:hypothetical protein